VLVTADPVGDVVQLAVADNGVGVPLEHQGRIFERFVQVPGRDAAGGAGLGLAIARETVRAHGGTIWVDSGPGPGSVFSFTLPVVGGDHDRPHGEDPT
jgi:NtrC-family two-component system sensor histidine kinase KinB